MRHFFHQLVVHFLTQIELGLLYKILLIVTYGVDRFFFTLALCIIFLIECKQTIILLILRLYLRVVLILDTTSCPYVRFSIETMPLVPIIVTILFPFSYSMDSLLAFFLICFILLHKLWSNISFQADGVYMILKVDSLKVLAENLVTAISFMSLLKHSHVIREVDILLAWLRITELS